MAQTALVVEGDKAARNAVRRALLSGGFLVLTADNTAQALERAEQFPPDVIVSGVLLPEGGAFSLRRAYERRFPARSTPFIFLSTLSDAQTLQSIHDSGADDCLLIPVPSSELLERVRVVLERRLSGEFPSPFAPTPGEGHVVTEERVGRGVFRIVSAVRAGEIVTVVTTQGKAVLRHTSPHPGETRVNAELAAQHADVHALLRDRVATNRSHHLRLLTGGLHRRGA